MIEIDKLLTGSPLQLVSEHAEKVAMCLDELELLVSFYKGEVLIDDEAIGRIITIEEELDKLKYSFRDYLLNDIYTSFGKREFLELLDSQDNVANVARDIARILSLHPLHLDKNLESSFEDLISSSFTAARCSISIVRSLSANNFRTPRIESTKPLFDELKESEKKSDQVLMVLTKKMISLKGINSMNFNDYLLFKLFGKISNLADEGYKLSKKFAVLVLN